MNFILLVKGIRECHYRPNRRPNLKITTGDVASLLIENDAWPDGDEGYKSFERYARAGYWAGYVYWYRSRTFPMIRSTGLLEEILESQSIPA